MGLGPPVLALYRQLKAAGVFDDITAIGIGQEPLQSVWQA